MAAQLSFIARVLGALSIALVVGCGGGPSALDACKKSCEKQGQCTNATALAIHGCKSDCDASKAQLSDADTQIEHTCENAGSVKSAIYDCYADFCDTNLAGDCANNAYSRDCNFK